MTLLNVIFVESFTDPKSAARRLLALNLGPVNSLAVMCVSIILAVVMLFALSGFEPVALHPMLQPMSALRMAATMVVGNLILVASLHIAARVFGAPGHFSNGLLLVGWLLLLQIALLVVQLVAFVISPDLAGILALLSLGFVIWVLINFVAVWHNLDDNLKAVAVFALSIFVGFVLIILLSIVIAIMLVIAGVEPPEGFVQ